MDAGLRGHLAELDVGFALVVTTTLATRLAHRFESMYFLPVTGHALDVAKGARIGLQVNTMPCRRCHTLPSRRIARDVTGLAPFVRNFGVRGNFVWSLSDPDEHLTRAGVQRLLVAVMARELGMFVLRAPETLKRRRHDMTAGAEFVGVLGVVPGGGAHADNRDGRHCGATCQRECNAAAPRAEPRADGPAVPNEIPDDGDRDDKANDYPTDLHPWRDIVHEESHDGSHATGQRRLDHDRVDRSGYGRGLLKRRRQVLCRGGGAGDDWRHDARRARVIDPVAPATRAYRR
jgi:hypothetical protein